MPAKKKTVKASAAKLVAPRRFRVLRAFGYEGVYFANHNAQKINDLPEFEIADRLERGFIKELRQRAPATTDAGE